MRAPRPPALCARCGRDVARGATSCVPCALPLPPWRPVPRDETTDLLGLLIAVVGFVSLIVIARVLSLGSWTELLVGFAVVGTAMIFGRMLVMGQIEWEAEGATATTAFGGITHARGVGSFPVIHQGLGQQAVRGDRLFLGEKSKGAAWPSALGANRLEIAIAAAFIGALARGRIGVTEKRVSRWMRIGRARSVSRQRLGSTFVITLLSRPPASEDALADFLLSPFCPPLERDYRGTPTDSVLPPESQPSVPLQAIIRASFPIGSKPGRSLRRGLSGAAVEHGPAERDELRALLVSVSKDDRGEVWIALRDALRQAFAQRGKQST